MNSGLRTRGAGPFIRLVVGVIAMLSGSAGIAAERKNLASALVAGDFEQIALRRTADNRFFLSGRLDGQRRSFLVDTGWSHTTVNRPGETGLAIRAGFKLGRVAFTNQIVRQERVMMGGKPAPFDVVLGLDFLRRHFAVLDCGTGRLFTRREPPTAEASEQIATTLKRAGYLAVELRHYENLAITCPASIAGHSFELLVDSGAAWTCLDWQQAESWGLKPQPSTTRLSGAGDTGNRGLAVAPVTSLHLGEMEISRQTIGLLDLADWGLAQEGIKLGEVKGLLGGEILGAYSAVIDCGALKLWLKPQARK